MTENDRIRERARAIDKIVRKYADVSGQDPDTFYMRAALELAELAAQYGDVPVGCVIVRDGAVIAAPEQQRRMGGRKATAHDGKDIVFTGGAHSYSMVR